MLCIVHERHEKHEKSLKLYRSHAGALIVMHKYFRARHPGRDSRQAILPDALWVNANLFQTDLCRDPRLHGCRR